jgi:hypothetical protein
LHDLLGAEPTPADAMWLVRPDSRDAALETATAVAMLGPGLVDA